MHFSLRKSLIRSAMFGTCLALAGTAMAAVAPSSPSDSRMATSGNGTLLALSVRAETTRVPDIAHLSTGVVTRAADADSAMQANAQKMTKVIAAIKAAGIEQRDIRTSGVNLRPQYDYGEDQPPRITGYRASNTVDINVRDIGSLGDVMDALVAAGANQINGPRFEVDDRQSALDEARRAAIDKARARADMYAETLGVRVRRIVSVNEGSNFNSPRPIPMMARADMERAAASTPIAPGESTLSVSLDVVFELGR